MADLLAHLIVVFMAGMALGAIYFAGLWVVAQRLPRAGHPGLLLLGSAGLRIGLLLMAWYWLAGGDWKRLLACLGGFLCARIVATRLAATRGMGRETAS